METPALPVETSPEAVREQLAFVDVAALEQLRADHTAEVSAARKAALGALGYESLINPIDAANAANQAEQQVLATLDDKYANYLDGFVNKDEKPDLYSRLLGMISASSIGRTTPELWHRGERGADGEFDPTTSGIYKYEAKLDALCEDLAQTTEDTPDEDDEEDNPEASKQELYDQAILTLNQKRKDLARISINRSTMLRKKGKIADGMLRAYQDAERAYRSAYVTAGQAAVALLESQGKSEADIRKAVAIGTVNEAFAKTTAEKEILDGRTGVRAKVARFLARPRNMVISNLIGGSATGVVIGKALKGLTAVAAAPALPAIIGFGVAAKTSKGVLQASLGNQAALYSKHGGRALEDATAVHGQTDALWQGTNQPNMENLAEASASKLLPVYARRVEANQDYNRKRALKAAVISGGAAVAAAAATEYLFDQRSSGGRPNGDRPNTGRPGATDVDQPGDTGNTPGGNGNTVTLSPAELEFRELWGNMTPDQQVNFIRMMEWQDNYIQTNGLMNDPDKYEKSVKAFVKGVKYMGKLEAARRS